ncbi:MAG: maleylpyruvate isomerase family mycothiol-dependent enzyme [Acidimicrobiia bacterium]
MDLTRRVELIELDSAALADAAERDLRAPIATCPGWDMAELVRHVLQVHRSWGRIVGEGRMAPEWSDAPLPPDDEVVAEFRANAIWFTDVLGSTDPGTPCWTWGPEQNAGFVQRFQVQEIALHRRDAEQAVGEAGPVAADGAADAIALVNELLPAAASGMQRAFQVVATDTPLDITMSAKPELPIVGSLCGGASDLLLVLWKRLPLETVDATGDVEAIAAAISAIDID